MIWVALGIGVLAPAAARGGEAPLGLDFLGEATIESGFRFEGTTVGGLSGIDYDPLRGVFYAISDDRSHHGPARFYELEIDLSDGSLDQGDIAFTAVTTILDVDGKAFEPGDTDPEAIRFDPRRDTLYWTSEGDSRAGIKPFVREMSLGGDFLRELETPVKFLPAADPAKGTRNNKAFESLTLSGDGTTLFTATEGALIQDVPHAGEADGAPSRVLRLDVETGRAEAEFIYVTEPAAEGARGNGLVEMLALGKHRFLMVERSFSPGLGNAILTFIADFGRATDVADRDSIAGGAVRAAGKTLLLDLRDLGRTLDNIEGLSFGPILPDGKRSLILVSDNNFRSTQVTQFLAFALAEDTQRDREPGD